MRSLPPGGAGILSYFTRHRTAANLLLMLLVVAGLAAIPQMRAQFFPDVISDEINIVIGWTGAGAEDVDEGIVAVLEPALLLVPGVVATDASSREGRASIGVARWRRRGAPRETSSPSSRRTGSGSPTPPTAKATSTSGSSPPTTAQPLGT